VPVKAKYGVVLFDLDGTLTDSGPGIIECVKKTLEHMNMPIPPQNMLRRFIGPPLWDSLTSLCGMNERQAKEGVAYFRKIYDVGGIYHNSVYQGIPQILREVREAGAAVAVATSKPLSMAEIVLNYFRLAPYFDFVSAADESDKSGGKEELIRPVLEKARCAPREAVMIGDTKFDAAGARKAGTDFIGVLYGFGTEEEMRREGGTVFVSSAAGLKDLLFDKT
jgi:phosphoglycolate phosphatase